MADYPPIASRGISALWSTSPDIPDSDGTDPLPFHCVQTIRDMDQISDQSDIRIAGKQRSNPSTSAVMDSVRFSNILRNDRPLWT